MQSVRKPRGSSSSDKAWDTNDDSVQDAGPPSLSRTRSSYRNPPPALFLHPSPTASHVSIPGIPPPPQISTSVSPMPPPPQKQHPQSQQSPQRQGSHHQRHASLTVSSPSVMLPITNPRPQESARSTDRTDALWAEMQATLEEVELSASGGTHVFGPDHDRKLEDLRAAQIALAQAWTRSEADDAIGPGPGHRDAAEEVRNLRGSGGEGTDAGKSTAGTGSGRPGSSGGGVERMGAKVEEETEADILLARKRREANDRYFERVNQGVLDVVAQLEEVAVAMRAVEQESKDVWGEGESLPGSAKT